MAGGAVLFAGCSPTLTPRVADGVTSASLAEEGTGVVLVTAGVTGGWTCRRAGLAFGKRVADGTYSLARGLIISSDKAPIAEVKLPPGEYHIVTLSCANRGKTAILRERVDQSVISSFKKSYATFTVQRGEVVNIGALWVREVGAVQDTGRKAVAVKLSVSDWSAADRAAFKAERPALYAQMRTRLMRLNAATATRED
jgi:hypothetical protein